MRYVLIDRFIELEAGRRAKAVKCVTTGEGFLGASDTYPPTLVLESLLQTGGTVARLVAAPGTRTMLGKVERAAFPAEARPGDRIIIEVEAILSRPEGTMCRGVAHVDGKTVGEADFMIVYLPAALTPKESPAAREQRRLLWQSLGIPWDGQ
jgi:3-hydroxymyristoyl/3-hydroxydecanoyl-(acyl carrier protein) dehydratase